LPEIVTIKVGKKKCQVILHYFTCHHQALRKAINNNVQQISRPWGQLKLRKKSTFIKNNAITSGMIKHLSYQT
jgi:hypothetical protein